MKSCANKQTCLYVVFASHEIVVLSLYTVAVNEPALAPKHPEYESLNVSVSPAGLTPLSYKSICALLLDDDPFPAYAIPIVPIGKRNAVNIAAKTIVVLFVIIADD